MYAGNCHKWLCAPKGSAFLHARPEAQPLIDPLVVSWDWVDGAAFHELHRWQGTRDPSAFLAVPAAIDFQASTTGRAVRARCHELLAAHDFGLEPLTDDFVQMRGFRVEHPDPAALKRRLYDEHRIEVPVFETPHGWVLRVSVQGYNDEDDLRRARRRARALSAELAGRQLLLAVARDAVGGGARAAGDDLGAARCRRSAARRRRRRRSPPGSPRRRARGSAGRRCSSPS